MIYKNKNILVVEDVKLNKSYLIELLSDEYNCIPAQNGKDALQKLQKYNINLIITDILMPIMDGMSMLEKIKNNKTISYIPILVVTSLDDKENINKAIELGADDVINKPFEPKLIKRRIQNILSIKNTSSFHNVMEEIIAEEIEQTIDELGICKCEQCRRDLMTPTLNKCKPKYVSTEKGGLISKMDKLSYNSLAEILTTIALAAETVKKNPHH